MSLPAYTLPVPTVTDTMQSYDLGDKLGIDTATDVWEIDAQSPDGLVVVSNLWVADAPRSVVGEHAIPQHSTFAAHKGITNPNHWALSQCIVPLDSATGAFPGVRVDTATRSGYFVWNHGGDNGMSVSVVGYKNGAQFSIPLGFGWDNPPNTNEVTVDGVMQADGFTAMLEVAGQNPVRLRMSVILSKLDTDHPGVCLLTAYPNEIGAGQTMEHAYIVTEEYEHYGDNRILTGKPGILANDSNAAGSAFNFNAGLLDYAEPVIAAIMPANATGSIAKLTASFSRGYFQYPLKGAGGASYPFYIKTQ